MPKLETQTPGSESASPGSALHVPPVYTRKATGLVREIPLLDMMAVNASVALPTGLALAFGLFFVLAAFPGANIVLDLLLAMVLVPFVYVTFALMAATMPRTGGDYLFGSRILHPLVGLFSIAATYVGAALGVGASAYFLTQAGLAPVFASIGAVSGNKWWLNASATVSEKGWSFAIAAAAILVLSLLSIWGTKKVARVSLVGYLFGLFALFLGLIVLLFTSKHGFQTTFDQFAQRYTHSLHSYADTVAAGAKAGIVYPHSRGYSVSNTIGGIFPAISVLYASFYGIYLAGEMKGGGKRRRQLIAIGGAGYFQAILLLIGIVIVLHSLGYDFVAAASNGNLAVAGAPAWWSFFAAVAAKSTLLAALIGLTLLAAFPGVIYGNMAMCQRVPFALAFDGLIPARLAEVSPRTHTPNLAIALAALLGVGFAVWASFTASFVTIYAYAGLMPVVAFVTVGIAAAVLPWRRPTIYQGSPADWRIFGVPVITLTGSACALIGVFLFALIFHFHKNLGIPHSYVLIGFLVGCLAFALVVYFGAKYLQRRRGVDIDLVYRSLPAE